MMCNHKQLLAMEALGQRLFETGQEIFNPSKEKRKDKVMIDTMKLIIGLNSSVRIVTHIRESSFLLSPPVRFLPL